MEARANPGSGGDPGPVGAAAAEPGALLSRAFADEPLFTYLWPDPAERRRRLPGFFAFMVATGRAHGLCELSPDGTGAAIWRRPGEWRLGWGTVALNLHRILPLFGTGLGRALRIMRLVERRHPARPHWYLAYLGVVPEARGKGVAGQLLRDRLRRLDRDGIAAYCETQKAENLGFYRAAGFTLLGQERVRGGPVCYFLWRDPAPVPEAGA